MSDLNRDIKLLIIDALGLEDIEVDDIGDHQTPVSYTHLTLPTTPYV